MKPVSMTCRIIKDQFVITETNSQITKSYRISALNCALLGKDILQMYMSALNAPAAPTIKKQGTRCPRLSVSPDYWTVTEFAALHRISEATVKRMCIRGELDARKIASRWRISGKPKPDDRRVRYSRAADMIETWIGEDYDP